MRGSKGEDVRHHSVVSPIAKVRPRAPVPTWRPRSERPRERALRSGHSHRLGAGSILMSALARAQGIVCGFGINSYLLGMHAAVSAAHTRER
eukprot:2282259-Prymnesium_polylepis.1